ncbi:MAG: hypothetical protein K1X29_02070 [Bdellovibrionales bacterium]|nr:hypothetical protein [Bdellovibrionales bacterium]
MSMSEVTEKLIHFILRKNEAVIQWLLVILLGLALWLVINSLFYRSTKKEVQENKSSDKNTTTDSHSAQIAPQEKSVQSPPLSSTKFADENSQLLLLQKELEASRQEIQSLKQQNSQEKIETNKTEIKKSSSANEDLEKIQALEQRLAEYAILEDDIANLKILKEENDQLKKELQKQNAIPREEVKSLSPSPPISPASEKEEDDLLTEFAASNNTSDSIKSGNLEDPSPTAPLDSINESGDVDTLKMLTEIEDLNELNESNSSALEEEADMEKMASEANRLLQS